jgi:osmoprotectant transport system substrate-binding protein
MVRAAALCLLLIAAGCSSGKRVVVGSKNFTEQVLLGEILAQHIERRLGLEVERKLNLGGTLLAHEALKGGSIDLYPEYTGTALTAVLKRPVLKDPAAVVNEVRGGYRQWHLSWLDPFGFNNTFAMVVRSATAERDGVHSLSDAARRREPWKIGVGYEFVQRPDGLAGLVAAYGLKLQGAPVTMDLGLLYSALESGDVEIAAANATDGQLARDDFTILADDRAYFPPYQCAIVVRDETLTRFAGLRGVLEELSGKVSDAAMRKMNASVDREHRRVADVAREFLAQ